VVVVESILLNFPDHLAHIYVMIVLTNSWQVMESIMSKLSQLYEEDYRAWARLNADLLQAGRFSELDIAHLVEELNDMSKSEQDELESRLVVLLAHLLKWQYQYQQLSERWQEFEGKSWRITIIEQRNRIAKRLKKSPGLKARLAIVIIEAYPDAVELAVDETGLVESTFPAQCPYAVTQILDKTFYPNFE